MAGKFTRLQKTYKIMDADGVAMYRGVTYGTNAEECIKPTEANAIPLGVVDNDERLDIAYQAGGDQTGKMVAVKLEGIAEIELSGVVTVGARVILDEGGTAIAMPATAGVYNVLGFAEKGGAVGEVIPVRMAYHVFTVTGA